MFGVIPLLVIRAIAQLVFVILSKRLLPTDDNAFALDLSTNLVDGILYFVVICLLVYFLMSLRLWASPSGRIRPQYDLFNHVQQAHYRGAMQPPIAQFPGQWGFAGEQPQNMLQGHPAPYPAYQVNNGPGPLQGNFHQQPYMGPVLLPPSEVKTTEGIQIQNEPLPPPIS